MKIKFDKVDDKALHVYTGVIMICTIGLIIYYFTKSYWSIPPALVISIIIGALKEWIYDKLLGKGISSKEDFIATLWGSTVGSIILLVILVILKTS